MSYPTWEEFLKHVNNGQQADWIAWNQERDRHEMHVASMQAASEASVALALREPAVRSDDSIIFPFFILGCLFGGLTVYLIVAITGVLA